MNLMLGDCLDTLKTLPDNSVDSVVTDPPYGLSFMGKLWDYDVPSTEIWSEVLRVLKPGGYLLSFFGTRTYHRGVVRIEDAGFEIRDQLAWIYGSGFPKSMDVSKAIDATVQFGSSHSTAIRQALDSRDVVGTKLGQPGKSKGQKPVTAFGLQDRGDGKDGRGEDIANQKQRIGKPISEGGHRRDLNITAPSTDEAKQWQGFGTALKPAQEPIVLARKPLSEKTVAKNVLKHGVGGLNIDASRIGTDMVPSKKCNGGDKYAAFKGNTQTENMPWTYTQGRWPANVLFDEDAASVLDEQSGHLVGAGNKKASPVGKGTFGMGERLQEGKSFGDSGGASRFFYVAKSSKRERNAGLEGMPSKPMNTYNFSEDGSFAENATAKSGQQIREDRQNHHPTVKPIRLMEYLVTMITPPGGTVLDPFMGSGSTGCAARKLGFKFIGCELSEEYLQIAERRIKHHEGEAV